MELNVLTLCYLVGSVTFILGLKMLSNPATARRGNLIAAAGMTLAVLGTIFLYKDDEGNKLHNYGWIFGGILIGAIIGTLSAKKVKMTAMPEMVSLFNGMGGACAALISIVEFNHFIKSPKIVSGFTLYPPLSSLGNDSFNLDISHGQLLIIFLGLIIGSVSFAGSIVAWGKLNGRIKDFSFKGQHIFNLVLLFLIITGIVYFLFKINTGFDVSLSESLKGSFTSKGWVNILFYSIFLASLCYGILFVMPIGGADMPSLFPF